MLQPANRLTLIDAMRPPAGFGFESAMAVTYTMNLGSLLAVPAVLALSGGADSADEAGDAFEPVELVHALRSHADKLTVFSQAGEIALPPSRRIFAFLEQAVVSVTAPGGIVHPKVWVLRYEAAEAPEPERRLRVLVSSRNLTFDTSWDTVIRLDEAAGPAGAEGSAGASLAPIGDLFEDLLDRRSTGPTPVGVELDRTEATAGGRTVDDRHRQRVLSLASTLREATFQLPEGVSDLRVHVLGSSRPDATRPGGGGRRSPLPRNADKSLIISPFLSDDFFTSVHPYHIDELVSRPESLDGLKSGACGLPCPPSEPGCPQPESLARVRKVQAFDDFGATVSDTDIETDDGRRTVGDPGQPLRGLHAKVFAFEKDGRARLFLGSANATGPAFRNNVEVLVELIGSTDDLGIDSLCEGNEDEPGLSDLFYTYRRACQPTETNGGPSLDDLRRQIAELRITGLVEPQPHPDDVGSRADDSSETWSVTYRSSGELPKREGVEIRCWPLAAGGHRQPVTGDEALDARFETSLESISGFLAFELITVTRDDADSDVSSFVVPVPLEGLPERRDRALMRRLVGNSERFLHYLLSLLAEDSEASDLAALIERIDGDSPADGGGPMSLPVLERLLRTMRKDPGKLAGLHPLVSDLAADDALPEGFAELWEMIHQVATAGRADQ
jgi:hypothetical protein